MCSIPLRLPLQALLAAASLLLIGPLALAIPAEAAFPGSNGKIAFYTSRDGNAEIYTMNADGTGQTNLTNNTAFDGYPAWSPDGTKIAFTTNRDGSYEIYVMNADGTGVTNITNIASDDREPAWSPDGSKIAFYTYRDGNAEIYSMNADGTGQTRLTNNTAFDGVPAWSPDGSRITFHTLRDGNQEIYVMSADGTGQANLTNNPATDVYPNWSPEGAKIAFTSVRDGDAEIYSMNADGTGQTRLTNNTAFDGVPAWSPDGSKIAFESSRDDPGHEEIYVMNADGTGQTNLTNDPATDEFPDWQQVDTTAPQTAIDSGPSGSTSDSTPTFTFSSSEAGSSFECRVDTAPFAPCGSPHTTAELASGAHTFEVRATDTVGNTDQTPASRSFTVDAQTATPPGPGGPAGPQPSPTPTPTSVDAQTATPPGPGGPAGPQPSPTPVVSKLNLRPSKFRAARSGASVTLKKRGTPIGTTLSYMLSIDATVTLKAERASKGRMSGGKCRKPGIGAKGRRCTRYVAVRGAFKVAGTSGKNQFKFMGRIANRRLARGRYRLLATPSAAGKKGAAVRASFRIK